MRLFLLVLMFFALAESALAVELLDGRVTAGADGVLQNSGGTVRLEDAQVNASTHPTFSVPEPGTAGLLCAGLGGLLLLHVRRRRGIAGFVLVLLLMGSVPASAQVPQEMVFSGRLVDGTGSPLAGPVDMELRLFDVETSGTQLYSEQQLGTQLDATGSFAVRLGLGTSPSSTFEAGLFAGTERWLEVVIGGEVLTPRQILGSVPYAFVAETYEESDPVASAALELLDRDDARLLFVGSWLSADESWSDNRIARDSLYTSCSGVGTDCSSSYIEVSLVNNRHRALSLSHMDWSNTEYITVSLSTNGGPEIPLRAIYTTRPDRSLPAHYHSSYHTLASDLPLGSDLVVRVKATTGRIHFEGMALSSKPLPTTIAPRTSLLFDSPTWAATDLIYAFQLDRAAVVDIDYGISGSLIGGSFLTCRLSIRSIFSTSYPAEGRSIISSTTFFNIDGEMSAALDAGPYTAAVECRTDSVVDSNPGGTDWHDRFLRIRFPDV